MTSTPNKQTATPADDSKLQGQSQQMTKKLVEIFGDADQTHIRMQGSVFHTDTGKFSNVMDEEAREKLRAVGLLEE